jgi:magnesium transporter
MSDFEQERKRQDELEDQARFSKQFDIIDYTKFLELSLEERIEHFAQLSHTEAEEVFQELDTTTQAEILKVAEPELKKSLVRLLAPDDAADLLQQFEEEDRGQILALMNRLTRKEVTALLLYAEDEAGGLMSPRYARLRPEMTVYEAISYLRKQARRSTETISYSYILDDEQHLLGVVSLRELFTADNFQLVKEIMCTELITAHDHSNKEEVSKLFAEHDLIAIPIISEDHKLMGIVTVDDALDVIEEEVTEDIHKLGGTSALELPYLRIPFFQMIKKRAGWLAVLFIGESLTATAMQAYEGDIARAVVLALFIPLIISSGGNAGSQASTLVVRALALGELRTRLWFRVLMQEFIVGITLGILLGGLGFLRIIFWPNAIQVYGEHYNAIALAIFFSVVGVVTWGTVAGSMLPLVLKRLGADPAVASTPFVATLVDVTGLIIYFTIASIILGGLLL